METVKSKAQSRTKKLQSFLPCSYREKWTSLCFLGAGAFYLRLDHDTFRKLLPQSYSRSGAFATVKNQLGWYVLGLIGSYFRKHKEFLQEVR